MSTEPTPAERAVAALDAALVADRIEMSHWRSVCGTTFCIAGWVIETLKPSLWGNEFLDHGETAIALLDADDARGAELWDLFYQEELSPDDAVHSFKRIMGVGS